MSCQAPATTWRLIGLSRVELRNLSVRHSLRDEEYLGFGWEEVGSIPQGVALVCCSMRQCVPVQLKKATLCCVELDRGPPKGIV